MEGRQVRGLDSVLMSGNAQRRGERASDDLRNDDPGLKSSAYVHGIGTKTTSGGSCDAKPPSLFAPGVRAGSKTPRFTASAAQDMGGRAYQEDRFLMINDLASVADLGVKVPSALYAVMDGHGGFQCAEYVTENLAKFVCGSMEFVEGRYLDALRTGLEKCERGWLSHMKRLPRKAWGAGTCVVAALLVQSNIFVAHVGDCRAVAVRSDGLDVITRDHKPNDPFERKRILLRGGEVKQHVVVSGSLCCSKMVGMGPHRVYPGGLAVARSIGTIRCKLSEYGAISGCVISKPDVKLYDHHSGLTYVVLASDGVWDVWPESTGIGDIIFGAGDASGDSSDSDSIARAIIREAKSYDLGHPHDNMTVVVVRLDIPDGSDAVLVL